MLKMKECFHKLSLMPLKSVKGGGGGLIEKHLKMMVVAKWLSFLQVQK